MLFCELQLYANLISNCKPKETYPLPQILTNLTNSPFPAESPTPESSLPHPGLWHAHPIKRIPHVETLWPGCSTLSHFPTPSPYFCAIGLSTQCMSFFSKSQITVCAYRGPISVLDFNSNLTTCFRYGNFFLANKVKISVLFPPSYKISVCDFYILSATDAKIMTSDILERRLPMLV